MIKTTGNIKVKLGFGTIIGIMSLILGIGQFSDKATAGGVYRQTKHGNTSTGVYRLSNQPRGDCIQCHYQHASIDGSATGGPYPYLLFAQNNNSLCYTSGCHDGSAANKIYQGSATYNQSGHNNSANTLWPGPTPWARKSGEVGQCINCHDPHGYSDSQGLIPAMTFSREENLCKTCHDSNGPATYDIASELIKNNGQHSIQHYIAYSSYTGRHDESEGNDPTKYGSVNRHNECVDCHNPHLSRSGTHSMPTNVASEMLRGINGIKVTNGSGGSTPSYTYISPDAVSEHPSGREGVAYEYQVCFKCHSSWAPGLTNITYPSYPSFKVTDVSVEFNPNNRAHHPVEAQGNNQSSHANYALTFVNPITKSSQIYCSDCHSSEQNTGNSFHPQGPHGSFNKSILAGSSESNANVCWKCHRQEVYNDGSYGTDSTRALSRFTHSYGAADEHFNATYNVWQNPCLNCHGGGAVGGIHGTNAGQGTYGTANLGDHFMNGVNIAGFTAGTAGASGSGSCWTPSGSTLFGSCHEHSSSSSENWTPNYEY
jgi:predicted CXXCH cytochrome family protein